MDKEFSCCRVEVDYDLVKSAKASLKKMTFYSVTLDAKKDLIRIIK